MEIQDFSCSLANIPYPCCYQSMFCPLHWLLHPVLPLTRLSSAALHPLHSLLVFPSPAAEPCFLFLQQSIFMFLPFLPLILAFLSDSPELCFPFFHLAQPPYSLKKRPAADVSSVIWAQEKVWPQKPYSLQETQSQ